MSSFLADTVVVGIAAEAWWEVAKNSRQNRTGLSWEIAKELRDRQSNSYAQTTFSENVPSFLADTLVVFLQKFRRCQPHCTNVGSIYTTVLHFGFHFSPSLTGRFH
jgi:hypothetical protein